MYTFIISHHYSVNSTLNNGREEWNCLRSENNRRSVDDVGENVPLLPEGVVDCTLVNRSPQLTRAPQDRVAISTLSSAFTLLSFSTIPIHFVLRKWKIVLNLNFCILRIQSGKARFRLQSFPSNIVVMPVKSSKLLVCNRSLFPLCAFSYVMNWESIYLIYIIYI